MRIQINQQYSILSPWLFISSPYGIFEDKISNPMPESVAVEQCLYLKARSNTTQEVFDALFVFCNSNNILFEYFISYALVCFHQ